MYDLHKELNEFFGTHVRLGKDAKNELARFRDNSLGRLKTGLDKLGEKRNRTYAYPAETKNQGGYAMDTLNQARNNDYDIDVALIFEKNEIADAAKGARERIRDAFIETGGQFKETPTASKNAVTVWYSTGQHLDFAIYRKNVDEYGNDIIEHASGNDWKKRDPDAVTDWFRERVLTLSPKQENGATVEDKQLRRIVRLIKFFTKSRTNWTLPGGMIVSALAVECYQPSQHRDDRALLKTLEVMQSRLNVYTWVDSPIDGSVLIDNDKRQAEIERLRDRLSELIPKMGVLYTANCTREQARNAWREFFNHEYWNAENDKALKMASSLLSPATAAPSTAFAFPSEARTPTKPRGFA